MQVSEWLDALVGFDTTSHKSNLALIDYLEDAVLPWALETIRLSNPKGDKATLIVRVGPDVPGGMVLSGHTDVVPVTGQAWETDPFTLIEKENRLYGRGTTDMKGFLACALAMAETMQAEALSKPLYLVLSYDEEIGCLAAPDIATYFKEKQPALVLVGEPTEMQVVHAHKGVFTFETIVTGKEAHSSLVHIGVNAIAYASRLITYLQELAVEYQSHEPVEGFEPPYSTIHVGVIHGGEARNIIPKHCSFEWEIRPLPTAAHQEDILQRVETFSNALEKEMKAVQPDTGIETINVVRNSGLKGNTHAEAEALMLSVTGQNAAKTMAFATEAGIFQRGGLPVILCGPGSVAQAHQPNEWIAKEQDRAKV